MKYFKRRHMEMAGLYFMFHADPKIGTGHLFRCCKIADFIREKYGIEFSFNFTEKPLPAARRLLEGRRVWSMGTHVEKLPCFGDRPALVVLDDYSIGFEEERLIREGVYRLAVIDDLVRCRAGLHQRKARKDSAFQEVPCLVRRERSAALPQDVREDGDVRSEVQEVPFRDCERADERRSLRGPPDAP